MKINEMRFLSRYLFDAKIFTLGLVEEVERRIEAQPLTFNLSGKLYHFCSMQV